MSDISPNSILELIQSNIHLIEKASASLTEQEVLALLLITADELVLEPVAQDLFTRHYHRGRSLGLLHASKALFLSMTGKEAVKASTSFLIQRSSAWESISDQTTNATIRVIDETGKDLVPDARVTIT